MSDCSSIDPLITPYVDGDIAAAERQRVDAHVRRCPPCHSRVAAEQAVRDLLHVRRTALSTGSASVALRERCTALGNANARMPQHRATAAWHARVAPLAFAAALVLAVGGAFLYVSTDRSTRLLAAELTADHVKCFGVMNTLLGTSADRLTIEHAMASTFGWQMHVPDASQGPGLELVGARPCLYAKGRVAHLMYRHNGHPVSVFMIPNMTRPGVPAAPGLPGIPGIKDEVVDVMGHEATVWSSGGRTFVVVAREPEADVAQVVSFVQAALK
jgi:anti-sigma factor RsiW